ncbi:MAG: hypothetical protein R3E57_11610 [Porticoccaceae bacterium]
MKFRKWLGKRATNKHLKLGTDIIILSASSYLMIKKAVGFSISNWLLENAFQQPLVNAYVFISISLLIIAIISKVIILYYEHFPVMAHNFVEPDEISDCLHRMNSEICNHLDKCTQTELTDIKTIYEQHGFKVNLALIVESMAEHIRKSITNIKIKKKDLFISLYSYDNKGSVLEYVLHFDPKRDLVETKTIDLNAEKYSHYECVKCISSPKTTSYVFDAKSDYAKGASNRHKSIQHYLGCKLYSGNLLFGFLNIEFHHNPLFSDEEQMQDFMEEHVYPFKLLLEYQFLKRDFFDSLKNFESNWRAA